MSTEIITYYVFLIYITIFCIKRQYNILIIFIQITPTNKMGIWGSHLRPFSGDWLRALEEVLVILLLLTVS